MQRRLQRCTDSSRISLARPLRAAPKQAQRRTQNRPQPCAPRAAAPPSVVRDARRKQSIESIERKSKRNCSPETAPGFPVKATPRKGAQRRQTCSRRAGPRKTSSRPLASQEGASARNSSCERNSNHAAESPGNSDRFLTHSRRRLRSLGPSCHRHAADPIQSPADRLAPDRTPPTKR